MGGTASDPTYPLVCTGSTGHSEIVLVAYDPSKTSIYDLLKCFWENHDPLRAIARAMTLARSTAVPFTGQLLSKKNG
jgi:peptide methionine sulfoxide reductase MsrA